MTTTENPPIALRKTREAAQRLSLSEKTVRDLVKRGLLRANRKTRHLLFEDRELDRFAQS
jgi:excisionase family DNA binding protein